MHGEYMSHKFKYICCICQKTRHNKPQTSYDKLDRVDEIEKENIKNNRLSQKNESQIKQDITNNILYDSPQTI